MVLGKVILALIGIAACGRAPLSEMQAVRDQRVILGLRATVLGAGITAHELVLCALNDEYSEAYLAENCKLALSSRSGKRVVFTQLPEANQHAGQQQRLMVIAAPVITGALAWFMALRRYYRWDEQSRKNIRWLRPSRVAGAFGMIALGTVAFTLVFEGHTAGAAERAAVRHWQDIFTTDKDFQAATAVRNVAKMLPALAQQLELKVTPAAMRMLGDK